MPWLCFAMAWRIGCRRGLARRLLPWRGSEVVAIAWHGGFRHVMAYAVAMAWLTGCRASHGSQVVAMAWRLSASHGMEVVAMTRRLSPWHGLCICHGVAYRLSPWHGLETVAMAWL